MPASERGELSRVISSRFELILSVQRDDVLEQVRMSGDIQWVAVTQDGWEVGVIFPDFEATRGFFEYLLDQPIDFNICWMVKDQNPFIEPHNYPKTDLMVRVIRNQLA